jgi:lipoyl(octanoyl) transferase
VPYREALELQRRMARDRIEGRRDRDALLLLEHEPVLTLGRSTDREHLRVDDGELSRRGVELVEIERGGDVTYHGPGQLVGYPVLDLAGYRKDLHWYLRAVESALVRALGELGLPAFRVPEHTGVWVGDRPEAAPSPGSASDDPGGPRREAGPAGGSEAGPGEGTSADADGAATADGVAAAILEGRIRKIASIGVHVSRWVTWHGFALNVTDRALDNFGLIVPCGIRGVRVTSLEREGVEVDAGAAGAHVGGPRVRAAVLRGFSDAFAARVIEEERPAAGGAP